MADDKKTILGRYGEIVRSSKMRDKPSKAEEKARDHYEQKKGDLDYYRQQVEDLSRKRAGEIADRDQHLLDISEAYSDQLKAEKDLPAATRAYDKEVQAREKTTHKMLQSKMLTATSRAGIKDEVNIYRHGLSFSERQQLAAESRGTPLGSLEERVQSGREILERRRMQLQEMSIQLKPGEDTSTIEKMASRLDIQTKAQGRREAALDELRKSGGDIDSVYRRTQNRASKAHEYMTGQKLEEDVRSGKIKGAEVEAALAKAAKTLEETAAAWKAGVENGANNISELAEQAKKASENFDELSKTQAEIKRQGGGGADWGNRLTRVAGVMQVGSNILNAGASIYRQWAIGQEMDTSNLRGQLMGVANQRFDDARMAARGDMAALMRLERYAASSSFGSKISGKSEGAAKAEAGGAVLGAGADAIMGGARGAMMGGGWGAAAGAINAAASGVAKASGDIAKLNSGAVQAEAYLNAEATKRAEFTAMDYQTAAVRQTAMDYTRRTWRETAGAGSGRAGILRTLRDQNFLGEMVNQYAFGSLDEISGLASAGIGALGKQFRTSDIGRAARAYDAGIVGSREEYMQMRGSISGLGGTDKELERIMKSAVAAGMDSSKNVGDMLNAMGHLASASSAGGYSIFSGASTGISATIQALLGAGVNANMAPGAAANIAATQDKFIKDRGLGIPDMIQSYQMMSKGMMPGLPGTESVATMTAAEARENLDLLDKKGEGALQEIRNRGFRKLVGKNVEETRKNIREQASINFEASLNKAYGGWAYGSEYEEARKKMLNIAQRQMAGETISKTEMDEVNPMWAEVLRTRGLPASPFEAWSAYGTLTQAGEKDLADNRQYDYEKYRQSIEQIESTGNATARPIDPKTGKPISSAFGKYQFTKKTAEGLGFNHGHMEKLGSSIEGKVYQDSMMKKYTEENQLLLPKLKAILGADKYTDEQLMAGMHYAGAGGMEQYLKTGKDDTSNSVNKGIADYISKFSKTRYSNKMAGPSDPGRGAEQAGGIAQLEEYKKGMDSVNGNIGVLVTQMQNAAKTLDPESFKPLKDASGDLKTSVANLAITVNALNLKLKGDEAGAKRELEKMKSNAQPDQVLPGGR